MKYLVGGLFVILVLATCGRDWAFARGLRQQADAREADRQFRRDAAEYGEKFDEEVRTGVRPMYTNWRTGMGSTGRPSEAEIQTGDWTVSQNGVTKPMLPGHDPREKPQPR